jgi:DNA modification methylase
VRLWSNRGETVLSPFAGIGSEGYEAIRLGRKFIGCELKPEYFKVACRNLAQVEASNQRDDLFSWAARQEQNSDVEIE